MRRIYESEALRRSDEPHAPHDEDDERGTFKNLHQSMVDWTSASHALVPMGLRDRAIEVSVHTDRETYAPGESVRIAVRMRNRLPFPIVLRTPTPVRWSWSVDGVREASHVPDCDPPDQPTLFTFHRSETKTFTRTWPQLFRETEMDWREAGEGTYEISAFVDVEDPVGRGLSASTEVEIQPD